MCEIACWRGYVTWQFYVESESPLDVVACFTVFPGARQGSAGAEDVALQAHATLVEALVDGRLGAGGLRRGVVLGALPALPNA